LLTNKKCDQTSRLRIVTLSLSVEPVNFHNRDAFCFCDTRTELLNIILMDFSIYVLEYLQYLHVSHFLCVLSGKYRVIRNDCRGFNNLSYAIHLR